MSLKVTRAMARNAASAKKMIRRLPPSKASGVVVHTDLSRRPVVSPDGLLAMHEFMKDLDPKTMRRDSTPVEQRIVWLLHGGAAGRKWASERKRLVERAAEA